MVARDARRCGIGPRRLAQVAAIAPKPTKTTTKEASIVQVDRRVRSLIHSEDDAGEGDAVHRDRAGFPALRLLWCGDVEGGGGHQAAFPVW
jgi:hypothetical protein